MEFAFYPLAQHAAEIGCSLDVNALILKTDLIEYYHRVPERFGVQSAFAPLRRSSELSRTKGAFSSPVGTCKRASSSATPVST